LPSGSRATRPLVSSLFADAAPLTADSISSTGRESAALIFAFRFAMLPSEIAVRPDFLRLVDVLGWKGTPHFPSWPGWPPGELFEGLRRLFLGADGGSEEAGRWELSGFCSTRPRSLRISSDCRFTTPRRSRIGRTARRIHCPTWPTAGAGRMTAAHLPKGRARSSLRRRRFEKSFSTGREVNGYASSSGSKTCLTSAAFQDSLPLE